MRISDSKKTPRAWTDEEIAMLKAFHAQGLPDKIIARRLHRTAKAVEVGLYRYDLRKGQYRRKFWHPDEDATLRQMWAENWSREAIAAKLDRTPRGIEDRAKKLGMTRRVGMFQHLDGRTTFRAGSNDPIERKARQLEASVSVSSQAEGIDLLQQLNKLASARHLIDFKRAGHTAVGYRANCEVPQHILDREPAREGIQPRPAFDFQSFLGSPADLCAV